MEQIRNERIEQIRYWFSEFEKNINNEYGGNCLNTALEYSLEVLSENNNELELLFTNNLISTYRRKLMEKAKELRRSDTPDSKQIGYIDSYMQSFVDSGFNNDDLFSIMKSEIDSQYLHAIIFDCFGRPLEKLTVEDKASLRKIIEDIKMEKA